MATLISQLDATLAEVTVVHDILLEDILPDPENTRKPGDDPDMPHLTASVKTSGRLVPARVRLNPPDLSGHVTYTMESGHRRMMACKLAGFKTMKAIIVSEPKDPRKRHLESMADNNARKSLNAIEDIDSIAKAKRENPEMTSKQIGNFVGHSESKVSQALTIADCPVAYAALSDGRLKGWSDAYEVAKVPPEKKQRLIAMRVRGATRDDLQKAAKVESAVNPAKTDPPEPTTKSRRVPIPVIKLNATVTVSADVSDLDGVLAILAEASDAVRASIRQMQSIPTAVRAWADKAKKAKALADKAKAGEVRDGDFRVALLIAVVILILLSRWYPRQPTCRM